jgi:hypothetical protein
MAILTLNRRMFACQGEFRRRMIERSRIPRIHRMTSRASGREISCNVIRIGSTVEIRSVAIDAVLVKPCIDIVHVTTCTWHGLMSSDERERCIRVVKC